MTAHELARTIDHIAKPLGGIHPTDYEVGVLSRPTYEECKTMSREEIQAATIWGITHWDEQKLGARPTDEEIQTAFFEQSKSMKREKIALARYLEETGGITVNGISVATDRESQAILTGAYVTCQINPALVMDWKGKNGWTQLDATAITFLAQAVSTHVQACFTKEKDLAAQVDAATTIADLDLITW